MADHHFAQRRDVLRDAPADPDPGALGVVARMSPADEAIAREEFERLLGLLPEDLRRVVALRLEGYTNAEIAAQLGRVERTVELKLRTIRGLLGPHLGVLPPGPGTPS